MDNAVNIDDARRIVRERLLSERASGGWWEGELSSSALSTAVASFALSIVDSEKHAALIDGGLSWLVDSVNDDGGWGDTVCSPSNISTTALCWAALARGKSKQFEEAAAGAEAWLMRDVAARGMESVDETIVKCYGDDRTFSAPILAMCALAGRLGDEPWDKVAQLPFEAAVLPRGFFKSIKMSVVSYAIPALIAIGLLRHTKLSGGFLRSRLRNVITPKALKLLSGIQPANGGFLEAAPLTAFVSMSLASSGYADHSVVKKGVEFLCDSVREDGSWPIDTNLATWLTSLSVDALSDGESGFESEEIKRWLLQQQMKETHPYTNAMPGGWGWTDRIGSVPDGDDTSGALLALRRLGGSVAAAERGIKWLLDIQNSDGGVPTFCRGWGRLPFDRSCPDITVHAMVAFDEWYRDVDTELQARIERAMRRAGSYLEKVQKEDGSWEPLWFGNQGAAGKDNPLYGTAMVVAGLRRLSISLCPGGEHLVQSGSRWIIKAQNSDGGWGGAPGVRSSIEETALALTAVAGLADDDVVDAGVSWLEKATKRWAEFPAAPIGLYFATLWYTERLYPIIFVARALSAVTGTAKRCRERRGRA